jgi:hypothetical protein
MKINHLVFPTVPTAASSQTNPQGKTLAHLAGQTPSPAKKELPGELPAELNRQPNARNESASLRTAPTAATRPSPVAKPVIQAEPPQEPTSRVIYTPADPIAKKALLEKAQNAKAELPKPVPLKADSVKDMSLEGQLEMGKKMGLFTHITVSKDGVLSARPERAKTVASQEFVTSAVTTMKDFADGIALLKQNSPLPAITTTPPEVDAQDASKPSAFQQIATRLNIFA